MIKSYKYRLYPTKKQEKILVDTLTTCRYLYNNALAERINLYKDTKKSLSYVTQANFLTKNKNEYQTKLHTQVLQDTLKRLDKSFKNFFRRVKNGEKAGFPRFKAEHRFNSFCYPQSGFKITNNHKRIYLSKIGDIKIRYSREIVGDIKTCSVIRDTNQWYVSITAETNSIITKTKNTETVGIDLGIKSFAVLSNNIVIDNPRHTKKSEQKLTKEQRRLSKKKKSSNNRAKQRVIVAKTHRRIRNQRNDFLHKTSTNLVKDYGKIVFEDLNIKGMVKNHKLAKHISDCSWNKLIQLTQYKAEEAGVDVVLVNPKNTTQKCSGCGEIVKKDLSVRTHVCTHCGLIMDRDLNASINIKNTVGTTGINACEESVSLNLLSSSHGNKNPLPLW
ncbi:MAG: RNA-guided endonuclease TnpB family protein [Phenylobacterium sp.]